jgi:hypothetical protein
MDAATQAKKLREASAEVSEGEMPPWFYVAVHRDGSGQADAGRLHVEGVALLRSVDSCSVKISTRATTAVLGGHESGLALSG